jgi:glycosyltransferase involved in cell wall biosynthesis
VPVCPAALRLDKGCKDPYAHHIRMLEYIQRDLSEFDIVHFHIDYLHFPLSRRHQVPTVTTLHGRLDLSDLVPLFREFQEMPVISISHAQRRPLPWVNWQATIHHGLPRDLHRLRERPEGYLAFIGRISPEKRVDRAVEIACRSGIPLKIAAKVDRVDQDYFKREIEPLLNHPLVEFIGEIGEKEKGPFLGNARALLFPIDWPEPFGLAMIESLSCGTPVIACRRGSVPEVIEDGVTGFIVDDVDAAVQAVGQLGGISRRRCREEFERRFTSAQMMAGYVRVYKELVSRPELTERSVA